MQKNETNAVEQGNVKAHYAELYAQHGRNHNAVQYSSQDSQFKRFEVLLDIAPKINSVIDVGCGLGDLLPALKAHSPNAIYNGYDFVDDFVADANRFYAGDPKAHFKQLDITQDVIDTRAEYGFISGMFNNRMPDNQAFVKLTLQKLWDAVDKGMAFNALTTFVDYQDPHLFYQDPMQLFAYCKTHFSPYVTLRHDYDVKENSIPFEFTIYVHKRAGQ